MGLENGSLGNAIRMARIDNKLTQEELAEKIGITPTHLKHIESEHRKPSIEVLFKIATLLHMSLDILFMENTEGFEKKKLIKQISLFLPECSEPELKAILAALHEIH